MQGRSKRKQPLIGELPEEQLRQVSRQRVQDRTGLAFERGGLSSHLEGMPALAGTPRIIRTGHAGTAALLNASRSKS